MRWLGGHRAPHVGLDSDDVIGLELLDDVVEGVLVLIGQDDAHSLLSEVPRHGETNARGCTRDDGNIALLDTAHGERDVRVRTSRRTRDEWMTWPSGW